MKKKIIILLTLVILVSVGFYIFNKEYFFQNETVTPKILYSWRSKDFKDKKYHLLEVIKERQITDLYHVFDHLFKELDNESLLKELKDNSVDLYHLTGHPSWAFESDATSIKKEIDKIIEFNKESPVAIKGIVLDIEPYDSDYKEKNYSKYDMLKAYKNAIEKGYEYALKNNIKYVICIPTWYDTISLSLLKDIIQSSDRIEVMNYVTNSTIPNISQEVAYAKELNKEITSIYEVDFSYEISEDDEKNGIFYSYKEMNDDFAKMQKEYNYEKLLIGYHYFSKM